MARYGSFEDPYCFPGTSVLRNRRGITSFTDLEAFETAATSLRSGEPLPPGTFNPAHYRAVHHHLFQDIYDWAGQYRTIRIAKNEAMFCYPEHIAGQMDLLFERLKDRPFQPDTAREDFVQAAASFLADLNAIHPFREGNGRTQLTFLFLLGERAALPLDMTRIRPQEMLAAMIASFDGKLAALEGEIGRLRT